MNSRSRSVFAAAAAGCILPIAADPAAAAAPISCDSGPQTGWKSQEQLSQTLTREGWQVRRTRIDSGCYRIEGTTPQGDRVEAYFHPVSLRRLLVSRAGEIIFRVEGQ